MSEMTEFREEGMGETVSRISALRLCKVFRSSCIVSGFDSLLRTVSKRERGRVGEVCVR